MAVLSKGAILMIQRTGKYILLLGFFIFLSGCSNTDGGRGPNTPLNKMKTETKKTLAKAHTQVNKTIEKLQNKAQNADEAIRNQVNAQIDSLNMYKNAISRDLSRVDTIAEYQWDRFHASVDTLLSRLHEQMSMSGMKEHGQVPSQKQGQR